MYAQLVDTGAKELSELGPLRRHDSALLERIDASQGRAQGSDAMERTMARCVNDVMAMVPRRRTTVALLASAWLPSAFSQTAPSDRELVIGQSCQLSGPLAALTSEVRQGANLYFDHVNAEGGVNGRKLRVVALDDAYDPTRAAENTRKLVDEVKVVALFQYAGTPPSMAALPLVEERRVPFVAPFTGSDA